MQNHMGRTGISFVCSGHKRIADIVQMKTKKNMSYSIEGGVEKQFDVVRWAVFNLLLFSCLLHIFQLIIPESSTLIRIYSL